MDALTLPSKAELESLRDRVLAKIHDRGEDPSDTVLAKLITALFELYFENPQKFYRAYDLPELAWPADKQSEISPKAVRSTLTRARKRISEYFENEGRNEPYRVTIELNLYRLKIMKHDLVDTQPIKSSSLISDNILGLVCSQKDWFNNQLIAAAVRAARAAGYFLSVAFHDGDVFQERRQINDLQQHCAGIVLVPALDEFAEDSPDLQVHLLDLEQKNYPLVFAHHKAPACDLPLVASDNDSGGWSAAEILHRELDCHAIHILAEPGSFAASERTAGASRYIQKAMGHQPAVAFAEMPGELGGGVFAQGLCERISRSDRTKIGVIATDDRLAEGVRGSLNEREHKHLRGRTTVIGFGGENLPFFPPKLSMYEDFVRIGTEAIEVLLQSINSQRHNFGKSLRAEHSRRIPVNLKIHIPDIEQELSRNLYMEKRPIEVIVSQIRPSRADESGPSASFGNPWIVPSSKNTFSVETKSRGNKK